MSPNGRCGPFNKLLIRQLKIGQKSVHHPFSQFMGEHIAGEFFRDILIDLFKRTLQDRNPLETYSISRDEQALITPSNLLPAVGKVNVNLFFFQGVGASNHDPDRADAP